MNSLRASTVLNWTVMNLIRPDGFSFREIHGAVQTKDSHTREISKPQSSIPH